jgi:transposase-like protein
MFPIRNEVTKVCRNDPKANGSLIRLSSIQPGTPGAELVNVEDLATNTNDADRAMEQNGTKRNTGADGSEGSASEKPGDLAKQACGDVPPAPAASPTAVSGLSPRQCAAIAKLVCGRTLNAAAAELGIGRTTLYRWRQDPAFSRELARVSEDAIETSNTRARNLMLKATRTLNDSLNSYDKFNWALKLVNSVRLWERSEKRPRIYAEDEATAVKEDEPFERLEKA